MLNIPQILDIELGHRGLPDPLQVSPWAGGIINLTNGIIRDDHNFTCAQSNTKTAGGGPIYTYIFIYRVGFWRTTAESAAAGCIKINFWLSIWLGTASVHGLIIIREYSFAAESGNKCTYASDVRGSTRPWRQVAGFLLPALCSLFVFTFWWMNNKHGSGFWLPHSVIVITFACICVSWWMILSHPPQDILVLHPSHMPCFCQLIRWMSVGLRSGGGSRTPALIIFKLENYAPFCLPTSPRLIPLFIYLLLELQERLRKLQQIVERCTCGSCSFHMARFLAHKHHPLESTPHCHHRNKETTNK